MYFIHELVFPHIMSNVPGVAKQLMRADMVNQVVYEKPLLSIFNPQTKTEKENNNDQLGRLLAKKK
jgi:hypothetical protein